MIELKKEYYFASPIWYVDAPQFLKQLDKASDRHIKEAQELLKSTMNERDKKYKVKKGDFGLVAHSGPLINDPKFKDFIYYTGNIAVKLLDEMGYNLKGYKTAFTELWVQEFSKKGGGHHSMHNHWNGHISGFYFLKASERTSGPIFQDPRQGALMNALPRKDPTNATEDSLMEVYFKPEPGKLMFFPSYIPHMFSVDAGIDPFRFIHFNIQAVPGL
jgi:uncharacterized protein (TIGR02466 family)